MLLNKSDFGYSVYLTCDLGTEDYEKTLRMLDKIFTSEDITVQTFCITPLLPHHLLSPVPPLVNYQHMNTGKPAHTVH